MEELMQRAKSAMKPNDGDLRTHHPLEFSNIMFFAFMASLNFEMVNLVGNADNGISISRLIFPVYIFSLLFNREFKFSKNSLVIGGLSLLIIYFATMSSLMNYSDSQSKIIDFSIVFCIILFIFSLSHQNLNPNVIKQGMIYFSFGSAFLAGLIFSGLGTDYDSDGRLTIFGDNSNLVGLRMSIAFSVFTVLITESHRGIFKRAAYFIAMISVFLAMITTGSRAAFLSVCFSLLIFVFTNIKSVRSLIIRVFSFVLFLLAFYWYLFENENALIGRLMKTYTERDVAGRDSVWQMYAEEFLKRGDYLFGLGFSGFESMSASLFNRILSPHNVILEVILLSGVAGLVIFLFINAKVTIEALQLAKNGRNALPLMLLSPYFASILTGQTLNNKIMWIILSFCLAPTVLVRRGPSGSQAGHLVG